MKSVLKYFVILLLLSTALTLVVYTGSSNATAIPVASATPTATPTVTPVPTAYIPPSFSSFFECIFGVRIFPGADPVGVYQVNVNPNYVSGPTSGTVSGHVTTSYGHEPIPGAYVYLGRDGVLIDSYIATTDENGYYEIDNVPFGDFDVYYSFSDANAYDGYGFYGDTVHLTPSAPNAVVNISVEPV